MNLDNTYSEGNVLEHMKLLLRNGKKNPCMDWTKLGTCLLQV